MITVTADTRQATRYLRAVRRRAIPKAIKRATDEVGHELAKPGGIIQRDRNKHFVKRRSISANVLRVEAARVANGRVKPTVVIVSANDILSAPRIRRWSLTARRLLPKTLRGALQRELAKAGL